MLRVVVVLVLLCHVVHGVTLDGELFVDDERFLGRMASFNKKDSSKVVGTLMASPEENPLLCFDGTTPQQPPQAESLIVLVPRGNCTFERKALIAQQSLGAVGMIVYNTLESRYGWNSTTESVQYPEESLDYECSHGEALISSQDLILDPPQYSTETHDDLLILGSPTNLCELDDQDECDSQRCLVTAKSSQFSACCAWDLHITMGADSSIQDDELHDDFTSMFVTMQQGSDLNELLQQQQGSNNNLVATLQTRSYSKFNLSSLVLWLLAIGVIAYSAFYSIRDYRKVYRIMQDYMEMIRQHVMQQQQGITNNPTILMSTLPTIPQDDATAAESEESSLQEEQEHLVLEEPTRTAVMEDVPLSNPRGTNEADPKRSDDDVEEFADEEEDALSGDEEEQLHMQREPQPTTNQVPSEDAPETQMPSHPPPQPTTTNTPAATTATTRSFTSSQQQANVLELTVWHAIGFVVVASSVLLLLFYFEFYNAVAVLYAFGTSAAVAQLIFIPVYDKIKWLRGPFCGLKQCQGSLTWVIVLGFVSAYALGGVWLYVGFTVDDPSTDNVFFWVTQNIMASCACIVFLSVIRLSSIKVATALLLAAFVYDIFFVFISPYLFNGESVMVTVATSGGGNNGDNNDENFCDKYPDDSDCQGGTVLPLVFTIPRINDYRGGSSLLGLGDVILPGLLIAFSARLDQAKRLAVLVGMADTVSRPPTKWYHGYLVPLIIAYAIGLMMAYVAVRLMERGQPALLYIVPCCLGTTVVVGRHELGNLWKGPPELQWANNLVTYCEQNTTRLTTPPTTLPTPSPSVTGVSPGPVSSASGRVMEDVPSNNSTRSLM